MNRIADLHLHSHYSMATGKECVPEFLDMWARRKGIQIIGTGDFTHPGWRQELKEKLEPVEPGLYRLKDSCKKEKELWEGEPRFLVTGEICTIYKKEGKTRRIHSLVLLPGMEEAEKVAERLEREGNLSSDGRPVIKADSRDLLGWILDVCPEAMYIPAHIWTPHFSVMGAFTGFSSLEECYEELTPYIYAVETGLSSDPEMNWGVPALGGVHLISSSDAHSPSKLGREATLFSCGLSYDAVRRALMTGNGLEGTLEFFPQEGKYFLDGHRKCGVCMTPEEARQTGGICPVCGKPLTMGVAHRIEDLSHRETGAEISGRKPFERLLPLQDLIAEELGYSSSSKRVKTRYLELLRKLGPEFTILRELPQVQIEEAAGAELAEKIIRIRSGEAEWIPGYDGVYGRLKPF